ncbi:hypothetical protein N7486_006202 [Penicillium sp. IBT 16267x]|nr:hypothetical protein N7486_006202 [Penicillium sp. IBT 16267x]
MRYSLFLRLWPKPVANNGSQLRDHQANERTFLSWNRMGLAFAAMSLALTRLDIIDNVFNRRCHDETIATPKPLLQTASVGNGLNNESLPIEEVPVLLWNANDLVASRICQVISVWSFGYSLARYVSVRRHLLLGRYVPAIWGPLLVTFGSLGVFGITLKLG